MPTTNVCRVDFQRLRVRVAANHFLFATWRETVLPSHPSGFASGGELNSHTKHSRNRWFHASRHEEFAGYETPRRKTDITTLKSDQFRVLGVKTAIIHFKNHAQTTPKCDDAA